MVWIEAPQQDGVQHAEHPRCQVGTLHAARAVIVLSAAQMLSVLKRLLKRLRQAWPDTLMIVRGDSHFAYPEVMQWIEAQANLHYVTGLTSNAVLQTLAHEVVEQAKRAYERDGGKITRFRSTSYQAGTWAR